MYIIGPLLVVVLLAVSRTRAQETSASVTVSTTTTTTYSKRIPVVELCIKSEAKTGKRYEQAKMILTDQHDGKSPKCVVAIFTACELFPSYKKNWMTTAEDLKRLHGGIVVDLNQPCNFADSCNILWQGDCASFVDLVPRLQALQSWVDEKSKPKK